MTLMELLSSWDEWEGDDTTIYVVEPWERDAEAALITPSPEETEPIILSGRSYAYFLECFIARELFEDVGAPRGGMTEEICEGLIYYATHDAWPR